MASYVRQIQLALPLRSVKLLDPKIALRLASEAAARDAALAAKSREAQLAADAAIAAQKKLDEHRWQELKVIGEEIQTQLEEMERRRQQSLEELQVLAVELAVEITSQLMRRVVERNEFPIQELVGEAISRLEAAQQISIRLHPLDLKQLQAGNASSEGEWFPSSVSMLPDPTLERGTCVADGGDFGLLSTWQQQIADMQRMLREGLNDAQVERRGTEAASAGMRRFPDRRETA
jgi:flagellar biosynthesis/type III secretory pathway protein FliH